MASRAQDFEPTTAVFIAGRPGLRPHARLTEASLSTLDNPFTQVSGLRGLVDSLSPHGGLTPGREGKGREGNREGKYVGLTSSFTVTSVTREHETAR